jgi:hypothetical protein
MRVLADGKFVARDGGDTWPTPMDESETSLEWRLRYATQMPMGDRMCAASIVSAYRELIALPRWRRDEVIRDLRAAIKASQSDAAADRHG